MDPRFDFHNIYDENYYRGLGADPLVNYFFDAESDLRLLEFAGLEKSVVNSGVERGGDGLMSEQGREHL